MNYRDSRINVLRAGPYLGCLTLAVAAGAALAATRAARKEKNDRFTTDSNDTVAGGHELSIVVDGIKRWLIGRNDNRRTLSFRESLRTRAIHNSCSAKPRTGDGRDGGRPPPSRPTARFL